MCGCRESQRVFYIHKFTLLIAVLSTAMICIHLQYDSNNKQKDKMDEPETTKQSVQLKHYDVLLSSYMRSGSTLTGSILGWRDDSFYVYEPLYKISRYTYWHGNNTVCRSDCLYCRKVDSREAVQHKLLATNMNNVSTGSLISAMKILRDIYDCQFSDFERTVFEPHLTEALGGPSWGQTQDCMKRRRNDKLCLKKYIPETCKKATHRVTKVLRLSTNLLADILRERKNLKAIHLFRDPRAIINSRIETGWYPIRQVKDIIENAKSLCNKMLYDFKEGQKLLFSFPDRFKFIYYEDLNENPINKSKELFKYFGMDLDENKYPKLKKFSVFSNAKKRTEREKNTAFWWRKSLKWDILQKIDPVCKDVFTELGYKCLADVKEYKDLSISSVNISKKYLIVQV